MVQAALHCDLGCQDAYHCDLVDQNAICFDFDFQIVCRCDFDIFSFAFAANDAVEIRCAAVLLAWKCQSQTRTRKLETTAVETGKASDILSGFLSVFECRRFEGAFSLWELGYFLPAAWELGYFLPSASSLPDGVRKECEVQEFPEVSKKL